MAKGVRCRGKKGLGESLSEGAKMLRRRFDRSDSKTKTNGGVRRSKGEMGASNETGSMTRVDS